MRIQGHREWLSEFNFWWYKGNKILELPWYDIEVTCVLQWCLSWFSAPTVSNETMRKNRRLWTVTTRCSTKPSEVQSFPIAERRGHLETVFLETIRRKCKGMAAGEDKIEEVWSVGNWEVVLRCPQLNTKPPEFVSARRKRFQHFALSSSVTVQQRPLTVLPTVELSRGSSVLRLCDSTTAGLTRCLQVRQLLSACGA